MVRHTIAAFVAGAACLLTGSGSAAAQAVDWRAAGGDLFGRAPAQADPAPVDGEIGLPRLMPLDQPFQEAIARAAAAAAWAIGGAWRPPLCLALVESRGTLSRLMRAIRRAWREWACWLWLVGCRLCVASVAALSVGLVCGSPVSSGAVCREAGLL